MPESEASLRRLGVMQGRLSAPSRGRIQSFPWGNWEAEFATLSAARISLLEWTLDEYQLDRNPLMDPLQHEKVNELKSQHGIRIESITCDFVMERPPQQVRDARLEVKKMCDVIASGSALGASVLVVPFVDNSSISCEVEYNRVFDYLVEVADSLQRFGMTIALEMDLPPEALATFVGELPQGLYGVNYDVGNSASLGYSHSEEIARYGDRIVNVHLKDRAKNGPSVPFGRGDVDFAELFTSLASNEYAGNFILQGARSVTGQHVEIVEEYIDFCLQNGLEA